MSNDQLLRRPDGEGVGAERRQLLADPPFDGVSEVRLSEAKATDEEGASGTGFLRIVSAKYGRPNERQYEVKDEIRKRLPKGPITNPVEILVSDALLRNRAGYMTQTGALRGNVVIMQKDTPCILTITYEYNGERFKKEVLEGRSLVLP